MALSIDGQMEVFNGIINVNKNKIFCNVLEEASSNQVLKTLCRPACFERVCCCFGINRQWRFICERTANGILQSNVSAGMLQEG